jgi:transmembrane sensor
MENPDAKELFEKFKAGTCNKEELEAITYWLHHFRSTSSSGLSAVELETISSELWLEIDANTVPLKKANLSVWLKLSAAAAILLILLGGLYLFQFRGNNPEALASIYKNDVNPGENKAYLILADGKKINLNAALTGKIEQPGVSISGTADGMLIYKIADNRAENNQKNTLETPNGGRFKVMLPDGTNVLLNAASSLTYPLSFKGSAQRSVTLTGEGYFEVAHDAKHPFLVQSGGQTVQVLGTHFNIQAYANEKNVKTTLISGSVKVYGGSENKSHILKPGEQAMFTSGDILVAAGDTEQATAWVSDDFVFVGEDLHTVMRQIARWYDVEVQYEGKIDESSFYSTISRKKKLSEILKALTLNQGVHFKLEGRRLTVMP